jgi:tetraacyldisaccharide 4'-kinase
MKRFIDLHRHLVTTGPKGIAQRVLFATLCGAGWFYGLAMGLRRALYDRGLLAAHRAPVPVISVGNLTVGGTGKTPLVDYLLKLMQNRGYRVAVVSRGYGGRGAGRVGVVCAGLGPLLPAETCGDEPYLLARRNPSSLVVVAPCRADGVRHAVENLAADLIILDDGFQHLAVARDLDIVLLDARRPLGNGRLLPAGILREHPDALKRAGLMILTRSEGVEPSPLKLDCPLIRCRHRLASEAVDLSGVTMPLSGLRAKRGVAFAGIADPENFFAALAAAGLQLLRTIPLFDHEAYDGATLAMIAEASRDADFLVTTEKDGVKLSHLHWPVPCYQVPMTLEFFDEGSLLLEQALAAVVNQEKS